MLLYSTAERWRFSVAEDPDALGCGALDIAAGASFNEADRRLRELVRDGYGLDIQPTWRQTEPGWWAADLNIPPSP